MAVIKAIFEMLGALIRGILDTLTGGRKSVPERTSAPSAPQPAAPQPPATGAPQGASAPASTGASAPSSNPFTMVQDTPSKPPPPKGRRVLQPSVIMEDADAFANADEIRIKAQPAKDGETCKFMVNRPLFDGHSWYFTSPQTAEGSPLAEAIFAAGDVETLLVDGSTATVTRREKMQGWETLAKDIGAAIRKTLESEDVAIGDMIASKVPSEDEVRERVQRIIETEVNPGVAAHGGVITLEDVKGNTVWISMGGGCQGCSAADVTLKQGIHESFRRAIPELGAIYDETDHGAGDNPFFR